jgi:hypothetical protein
VFTMTVFFGFLSNITWLIMWPILFIPATFLVSCVYLFPFW